MMEVYYEKYPKDKFKVLGVEIPFSFEIEDVGVPIIGCMDLILQDQSGSVVIVDHKTSNKAKSKSDVDKSLQLTFVSHGC